MHLASNSQHSQHWTVIGTSIVPAAMKIILPDGDQQHVGQRIGVGKTALGELRTDARLVLAAKSATRDGLELPAWPASREGRAPRVVEGKICSTDTWTQDASEIRRLSSVLDTSCEEMEAFGVLRAASHFGITRCIAIKDISNNELSAGEATDGTFSGKDAWILDEIGERAATLAAAVIESVADSLQ